MNLAPRADSAESVAWVKITSETLLFECNQNSINFPLSRRRILVENCLSQTSTHGEKGKTFKIGSDSRWVKSKMKKYLLPSASSIIIPSDVSIIGRTSAMETKPKTEGLYRPSLLGLMRTESKQQHSLRCFQQQHGKPKGTSTQT